MRLKIIVFVAIATVAMLTTVFSSTVLQVNANSSNIGSQNTKIRPSASRAVKVNAPLYSIRNDFNITNSSEFSNQLNVKHAAYINNYQFWSGYVAESNYSNPKRVFDQVYGSFKVPSFEGNLSPDSKYYNDVKIASFWVGVGGFLSNVNTDVFVQAGIDLQVNQSTIKYVPWFEDSKFIEDFTLNIHAGDILYISVFYYNSNTWKSTIDDITTNRSQTLSLSGIPYSTGYSAEWITEDPIYTIGTNGNQSIAILSDFGAVGFGPIYTNGLTNTASEIVNNMITNYEISSLSWTKLCFVSGNISIGSTLGSASTSQLYGYDSFQVTYVKSPDSISGQVSHNGNGVSDASVVLKIDIYPKVMNTTANTKGFYSFNDVISTGSYQIYSSYGNENGSVIFSISNITGANLDRNISMIYPDSISGRITSYTGSGATNASVTLNFNGSNIASTKANPNGYYSFHNIRQIGWYYIYAKFYDEPGSGSVDVTSIDGNSYTVNIKTAAPVQGGCVLNGTMIMTSQNNAIPVQDLKVGNKVLSYDTVNGDLFEAKVAGINKTNVTSIFDINNGKLFVSGATDQPIYVTIQNGTQAWIMIGYLNTTDKIYDPVNNTWIAVKSVNMEIGNFTVFDIVENKFVLEDGYYRSDYIANGILLDRKIT